MKVFNIVNAVKINNFVSLAKTRKRHSYLVQLHSYPLCAVYSMIMWAHNGWALFKSILVSEVIGPSPTEDLIPSGGQFIVRGSSTQFVEGIVRIPPSLQNFAPAMDINGYKVLYVRVWVLPLPENCINQTLEVGSIKLPRRSE